ncbi:hypothetical protein QBC35DRAFT_436458 [Podospora australis]|uniref:MYND-type domain-containing protein n=1 Tax=Podospora australis TaxID=1536484 RepID=A0AAN6WRK7_9PEZI|nr:hypothetical protein QBC35DRAFT_436458 [Podospora australis]
MSEFFRSSIYGLVPERCVDCHETSGLVQCDDCNMISYCGTAHRDEHRSDHHKICEEIKTYRNDLQLKEAALRTHPADFFTTGVGSFWSIRETRPYMMTRLNAASAYVEADTVRGVEEALSHYTDMIRLDRSDHLGVRNIIPGLLLRLRREQECYDFIKYWATTNPKDVNPAADSTTIKSGNAFEPIEELLNGKEELILSQLVILTLLKLRLRFDLSKYETYHRGYIHTRQWGNVPLAPTPGLFDRPMGEIVKKAIDENRTASLPAASTIQAQYQQLLDIVHARNPHFWELMVEGEDKEDDEGNDSERVEAENEEDTTDCDDHGVPRFLVPGAPGSKKEASEAVEHCADAWEESGTALREAMARIGADTAAYVAVYNPSPSGEDAVSSSHASASTLGHDTAPMTWSTPPRILTISLQDDDYIKMRYEDLVTELDAKAATMDWATTSQDALNALNLQPAYNIILITDPAITHQKKLLNRVIDRIRAGATVIIACGFGSSVSQGEFNRMFGRIGLPWKRGSYHRKWMHLRGPPNVSAKLARHLPPRYSQKAVYVCGMDQSAVWYAESDTHDEAAVVFASVGSGKLGYVGDINGEVGSTPVVLAMCGLLG